MMNIYHLFWMFVILFAIIGAARGWAKELLVSFSVVVALALNQVLRSYFPWVKTLPEEDIQLFWLRTTILLVLVAFGYQTVSRIPLVAARAARENVRDNALGVVFGGINGYLVAGTILYYMIVANYPFHNIILPPTDPAVIEKVAQLMVRLPPQLLGIPGIYIAIILAFIFVLVVYI